MEKVRFQAGDIILYDGLYRCGEGRCDCTVWGVAGRRVSRLACGHDAELLLVRRRVDQAW